MDARADRSATLTGPPPGPRGWPQMPLALLVREVTLAAGRSRAGIAARLGLNPNEVDAMEHALGGDIGPVELSRRLQMTSASSTALVDRLEAAGHVVREPDPDDGRRCVIRATPYGTASVHAQVDPLVTDLVALELPMCEHDRQVVTDYLRRVVEVLDAHAEGSGAAETPTG
jgi:DNA-binding MarR family transcriptional regulator